MLRRNTKALLAAHLLLTQQWVKRESELFTLEFLFYFK